MQTFKDFKGLQIYVAFDRPGYLYGLYAAKTKARLIISLGEEVDELRIERASRKSITDPDEVRIMPEF